MVCLRHGGFQVGAREDPVEARDFPGRLCDPDDPHLEGPGPRGQAVGDHAHADDRQGAAPEQALRPPVPDRRILVGLHTPPVA